MIYVKIAEIPGPVTTSGFENTFEAGSVNLGHVRTVASRAGNINNVTSSLGTINEVVLTKNFESASTKIFEYSLSGTPLNEVVISFARLENNQQTSFCDVTLKHVVISAYQLAGVGGADNQPAVETFNLNWGSMEIKNSTGKSPASTGWDLATNKKS